MSGELVPPSLFRECWDASACKPAKELAHSEGRARGVGHLADESASDFGGVQVQLVEQERIRADH